MAAAGVGEDTVFLRLTREPQADVAEEPATIQAVAHTPNGMAAQQLAAPTRGSPLAVSEVAIWGPERSSPHTVVVVVVVRAALAAMSSEEWATVYQAPVARAMRGWMGRHGHPAGLVRDIPAPAVVQWQHRAAVGRAKTALASLVTGRRTLAAAAVQMTETEITALAALAWSSSVTQALSRRPAARHQRQEDMPTTRSIVLEHSHHDPFCTQPIR